MHDLLDLEGIEVLTLILEVLREDCGVSYRLHIDTWYYRKCSSAQALQVVTSSFENSCWLSIKGAWVWGAWPTISCSLLPPVHSSLAPWEFMLVIICPENL